MEPACIERMAVSNGNLSSRSPLPSPVTRPPSRRGNVQPDCMQLAFRIILKLQWGSTAGPEHEFISSHRWRAAHRRLSTASCRSGNIWSHRQDFTRINRTCRLPPLNTRLWADSQPQVVIRGLASSLEFSAMGYTISSEDSTDYAPANKHNRSTSRDAFATGYDGNRGFSSTPSTNFKNKSQAPFRPISVYKKAKDESKRLVSKAKWVGKDLTTDLGRWRRQRFG